jgi:hypothetical protein
LHHHPIKERISGLYSMNSCNQFLGFEDYRDVATHPAVGKLQIKKLPSSDNLAGCQGRKLPKGTDLAGLLETDLPPQIASSIPRLSNGFPFRGD